MKHTRFILCIAIAAMSTVNLAAQTSASAQATPTPAPPPKVVYEKSGKEMVVKSASAELITVGFPQAERKPTGQKRQASKSSDTPSVALPVVLAFTSDKPVVKAGETVELRWQTSGATTGRGITIAGEERDPIVLTDMADNGHVAVKPERTTAYVLYAHNQAGTVNKVVVVEVIPTSPSWYETWEWWQWLLLLLFLVLLGYLIYRLIRWLNQRRDREMGQTSTTAGATNDSTIAAPANTAAHAVQVPAGGLVSFTINIHNGGGGQPTITTEAAAPQPVTVPSDAAAAATHAANGETPAQPEAAALATVQAPDKSQTDTAAQNNETN